MVDSAVCLCAIDTLQNVTPPNNKWGINMSYQMFLAFYKMDRDHQKRTERTEKKSLEKESVLQESKSRYLGACRASQASWGASSLPSASCYRRKAMPENHKDTERTQLTTWLSYCVQSNAGFPPGLFFIWWCGHIKTQHLCGDSKNRLATFPRLI